MTTLRLDDSLAQVQTQSIAASMPPGGVELDKGLKYVCDLICRYTAAIVVDNDANVRYGLLKTKHYRGAVRQRKLECIVEQVVNQNLDQGSLTIDLNSFWWDVELDSRSRVAESIHDFSRQNDQV